MQKKKKEPPPSQHRRFYPLSIRHVTYSLSFYNFYNRQISMSLRPLAASEERRREKDIQMNIQHHRRIY